MNANQSLTDRVVALWTTYTQDWEEGRNASPSALDFAEGAASLGVTHSSVDDLADLIFDLGSDGVTTYEIARRVVAGEF